MSLEKKLPICCIFDLILKICVSCPKDLQKLYCFFSTHWILALVGQPVLEGLAKS